MLIINADDFGRSPAETEATVALASERRVTSVSAMVFMSDSERAAGLSNQMNVDVGLHLNFCERWNGGNVPSRLAAEHEALVRFFNEWPCAAFVYNPWRRQAFRAVYEAQVEEFHRLYRRAPSHMDGHRHLHLCANMLVDTLIPRGFAIRRNFTFGPGEKGVLNRAYRQVVDAWLKRRYVLTDYFFSLDHSLRRGGRSLRTVAELAKDANVEIMTHPQNPWEFEYLAGDRFLDVLNTLETGGYTDLSAKPADGAPLSRVMRSGTLRALLASLSEWSIL